jgi:hypothetical protein
MSKVNYLTVRTETFVQDENAKDEEKCPYDVAVPYVAAPNAVPYLDDETPAKTSCTARAVGDWQYRRADGEWITSDEIL